MLELNASDERGIDVVREQIKTFAGTRNLFSNHQQQKHNFKLVILDESDAMTSTAQNALRRGNLSFNVFYLKFHVSFLVVMEKYVKHVRFILICNYASQLIPAIQSRCTRFRFSPIGKEGCLDRLERVIKSENLAVSSEAKEALFQLSKGDMRRVLNVLQAAASTIKKDEVITDSLIYAVTAAPHPSELDRILDCLLNSTDFQASLKNVRQIQDENGIALQDIVGSLFDRVNDLKIPTAMRIYITKQLADLEYRLSHGTNEALQMGSLVGVFLTARCYLNTEI